MTNEKEPKKDEKNTKEELTLEKMKEKMLATGQFVVKELPPDQAIVFFKK